MLTPSDASGQALPDIVGIEVHDAIVTLDGVDLAVVVEDRDIYSLKYCENNVCAKMEKLRVDQAGKLLYRTTLTQKGNTDSVGARFM
jgi:hypothetical protein